MWHGKVVLGRNIIVSVCKDNNNSGNFQILRPHFLEMHTMGRLHIISPQLECLNLSCVHLHLPTPSLVVSSQMAREPDSTMPWP